MWNLINKYNDNKNQRKRVFVRFVVTKASTGWRNWMKVVKRYKLPVVTGSI